MAVTFKSSLFLFGTLVAWMLLTSFPAVSPAFPKVSLRWKHHLLGLASSQLVSFLLTQLCSLLMCGLLYEVSSAGRALLHQPHRIVLILLLVSMLQYGLGMHDICVMVESGTGEGKGEGSAMSSPLTALVEFWHELSHNMFAGSFYLLLLLAIVLEREQSVMARLKKSDEGNSDTDMTTQDCTGFTHESANTHWALPLKWIWSAIVGMYFAIFALQTSTWVITLLYFVAVLVMKFTSSSPSNGRGVVQPLSRQQQVCINTMTKAALVGIPSLIWQLILT